MASAADAQAADLSSWPCGPPSVMKTIVGRAILPAGWLSAGSGRLKAGCGQDWPPHSEAFDGAPTRRATSGQTGPTSGQMAHAIFMRRKELGLEWELQVPILLCPPL